MLNIKKKTKAKNTSILGRGIRKTLKSWGDTYHKNITFPIMNFWEGIRRKGWEMGDLYYTTITFPIMNFWIGICQKGRVAVLTKLLNPKMSKVFTSMSVFYALIPLFLINSYNIIFIFIIFFNKLLLILNCMPIDTVHMILNLSVDEINSNSNLILCYVEYEMYVSLYKVLVHMYNDSYAIDIIKLDFIDIVYQTLLSIFNFCLSDTFLVLVFNKVDLWVYYYSFYYYTVSDFISTVVLLVQNERIYFFFDIDGLFWLPTLFCYIGLYFCQLFLKYFAFYKLNFFLIKTPFTASILVTLLISLHSIRFIILPKFFKIVTRLIILSFLFGLMYKIILFNPIPECKMDICYSSLALLETITLILTTILFLVPLMIIKVKWEFFRLKSIYTTWNKDIGCTGDDGDLLYRIVCSSSLNRKGKKNKNFFGFMTIEDDFKVRFLCLRIFYSPVSFLWMFRETSKFQDIGNDYKYRMIREPLQIKLYREGITIKDIVRGRYKKWLKEQVQTILHRTRKAVLYRIPISTKVNYKVQCKQIYNNISYWLEYKKRWESNRVVRINFNTINKVTLKKRFLINTTLYEDKRMLQKLLSRKIFLLGTKEREYVWRLNRLDGLNKYPQKKGLRSGNILTLQNLYQKNNIKEFLVNNNIINLFQLRRLANTKDVSNFLIGGINNLPVNNSNIPAIKSNIAVKVLDDWVTFNMSLSNLFEHDEDGPWLSTQVMKDSIGWNAAPNSYIHMYTGYTPYIFSCWWDFRDPLIYEHHKLFHLIKDNHLEMVSKYKLYTKRIRDINAKDVISTAKKIKNFYDSLGYEAEYCLDLDEKPMDIPQIYYNNTIKKKSIARYVSKDLASNSNMINNITRRFTKEIGHNMHQDHWYHIQKLEKISEYIDLLSISIVREYKFYFWGHELSIFNLLDTMEPYMDGFGEGRLKSRYVKNHTVEVIETHAFGVYKQQSLIQKRPNRWTPINYIPQLFPGAGYHDRNLIINHYSITSPFKTKKMDSSELDPYYFFLYSQLKTALKRFPRNLFKDDEGFSVYKKLKKVTTVKFSPSFPRLIGIVELDSEYEPTEEEEGNPFFIWPLSLVKWGPQFNMSNYTYKYRRRFFYDNFTVDPRVGKNILYPIIPRHIAPITDLWLGSFIFWTPSARLYLGNKLTFMHAQKIVKKIPYPTALDNIYSVFLKIEHTKRRNTVSGEKYYKNLANIELKKYQWVLNTINKTKNIDLKPVDAHLLYLILEPYLRVFNSNRYMPGSIRGSLFRGLVDEYRSGKQNYMKNFVAVFRVRLDQVLQIRFFNFSKYWFYISSAIWGYIGIVAGVIFNAKFWANLPKHYNWHLMPNDLFWLIVCEVGIYSVLISLLMYVIVVIVIRYYWSEGLYFKNQAIKELICKKYYPELYPEVKVMINKDIRTKAGFYIPPRFPCHEVVTVVENDDVFEWMLHDRWEDFDSTWL